MAIRARRCWASLVLLVACLPVAAQTGGGMNLDQMMAVERQDMGVAPTDQLHDGAMHGPTPASIPGGQIVTTKGLSALLQAKQAPYVLFDVLGGPETLPGAIPAAWLAQPGSFQDPVQRQAEQALAQATRGGKDVVLVFYCAARECWLSYNAALRAIRAGYKNVLWYRGGIEAWKYAGLPMQPASSAAPPGAAPPAQAARGVPQGFVAIQPVPRGASGVPAARPAPQELRIGQGKFFTFALPPDWRVGEDGQFALTLVANDGGALTVMVGNAGMPVGYAPQRYAYEKLNAMQPQNLQLGNPRQGRAVNGFQQAAEFDVAYVARNGTPYRGTAKISIANAYDSQTMVMNAALAPADQWPGYQAWLPQVADQIAASNGGAFGMRGVMSQNLANSREYAQAAASYRDWSQKTQAGVVADRNRSQDAIAAGRREGLGAVQTYANPFGQPAVELPLTSKYYWTDRNGAVVGTDDPSLNPNAGSTGEWRRMERVQR